jgi:transglutaminase-like putative cysteine protease
MAAQRPSSLVSITRAGLTVAVAVGLTAVFAERAWLTAALVAAIAPHVIIGFAARRRWNAFTTLAALVGALFLLTLYIVEAHTISSALPTQATFSSFFDDLRDAPHVLRTAVVPVAPERGALLLAIVSLFGAGAIAEWSARRLDATLGAMGPSLVMFVTIAALGDGSWVAITILYTLAGALYLLALHHDEVRERRSWFHATEPRRSNTLVGGVIAAAAIVAGAAIIGPGVPGARSEPWIDYRALGDGDGGGLLNAETPIISIQAKLQLDPDRQVFTVDIGEAEPRYWRVIALDEYDGNVWKLNDTGEPADELDPPSEPPTTEELDQTFTITAADAHWLPAAYRPTSVSLENALAVEDSATLYLKSETPIVNLSYDVTSELPVTDVAERRAAPPVDPGEWEQYLELPSGLSQDVHDLAADVTAGAETPWDKAEALANYLGRDGGFTYNLNVAREHDIDRLEEFLFETKEGYCEQFASAFGAMARSVGLPTRIAVGYTYGTEFNGSYIVRNRDAHAWPEVYFTGLGWISLEPTPQRFDNASGTGDPQAAPVPAATDDPGAEVTTTTVAPGTFPDLTLPTRDPDENLTLTAGESAGDSTGTSSPFGQIFIGFVFVAGTLLVIAAVGLACLVVRAARRTRRRRHAPDPRDRVLGAWAYALDHLAEAGVERRPSATPVEFALRHAPAHGAGDAGPPLMELAQLQTAALFAPDPPSDEEARDAWRNADAVNAALKHSVPRSTRWFRRLDPRRTRETVDA